MLETAEKEELEKGMRLAWIIWGALLGSLAVYVFVCHMLGDTMKNGMGPDFPVDLLTNILYVVAAAELILAYFIRRIMLSLKPGATHFRPSQQGITLNYPPPLARYLPVVLVSLAISESVGIYGLVLFLLGAEFKTLYSFIFVSAAAMFFYRPKFEELKQLALAMKGHP